MRAPSLLAVLAASAAAACYRPTPPAGAPCANGECPAGLHCVDQVCVDLAIDAGPDACVAPRCDGSDLVGCDQRVSCPFGCVEQAPARCRGMVPSNAISPQLLDGATALVINDRLTFSSTSGQISRNGVVVRAAGMGVVGGIGFTVVNGMGVWTAQDFTVPAAATWRITGVNSAVLYAANSIVVEGTIDAGGSGSSAGAGGLVGGANSANPGCRGRAGKQLAAGFGEGGGGAGGATEGGDGAPGNQITFGAGGPMCATPSVFPLRGGNGGGAGGVDAMDAVKGGNGGGGGGGIALVAMIAIVIDGTVAAPGGGGGAMVDGDGGGGGGGGGAVLIEAPLVTIEGALTANGGGGGAPSMTIGNRGLLASTTAATGGLFMGRAGGRGGAGVAAPTDGQTFDDGMMTIARGGGGGGAAGVIHIRGELVTLDQPVVSPPPTMSRPEIQ